MDKETASTRKIEEGGVIIEGGAFYNPAQKFNRTLTIKVINNFIRATSKEGVSLLECMSATGLRGIRYAKELEGSNKIVMNDISSAACESIINNCAKNGIGAGINQEIATGTTTVEIRNEDCRSLMLNRKREFDVIDIDPFGTCSPYIETALEGLKEGGLLCVTSTDTKVLCDKPPESCYKYYGSVSMNNSYSHEIAVRIVLSYISRVAAKSGKFIEPLVSLSMDFFIRVFIRVSSSKQQSNYSLLKNKNYFMCTCLNREVLPILKKEENKDVFRHQKLPVCTVCRLCKRQFGIYGPFWDGPLHNKDFLVGVIDSIDESDIQSKTGGVKETAHTLPQINRRIHGMLCMARDEIDEMFYYSIPTIASVLSFPVPPLPMIISFLHRNNITVSLTHCKPNAIKTSGEIEYVYLAVILYYERIKPEIYAVYNDRLTGKRQDIDKNTHNLMMYLDEYKRNKSIIIDFTVESRSADITSRKYLKFQDKSGLGWGPMKK
ncbi:tRNA (guanine26-N2/guanine27-N2)-dimethyltransferase [Nematocida parisii]|nr:tRNA (guanine26-N2/guanine27-N2)-dimethyltransferase [Nematocida parisii]KAI5128275.1 tRNA (guanine26-N2/guanine27-N2)-dimethyltransferase [Nematocida parisii]KAI5140054.1 tRNA (guanine26-N2/guanine27-N2)-dimethyltransferase [Nematocida parisii]KAI5144598.1 tRNA (guanine26-N2/guanine27-N2)-dimethyltransferase [Nematocida parisii]KAI5153409.1 tRNA (guanine26-N2/guanine27-N2)-dimethyltransferase [Nematocida parisii]